jgi:hypothetical protein
MILVSERFDQQNLADQWECDRVASRYRASFALIDWRTLLPDEPPTTAKVGKPAHPKSAYIKALLVPRHRTSRLCHSTASLLTRTSLSRARTRLSSRAGSHSRLRV